MSDLAEPRSVNKPRKSARPLADLIGPCVADAFARQGFANTEIVTHWEDIVGADIAAHAEPVRMTWPRRDDPDDGEPATLVLRCEGPAAIEIQHLAPLVLERVNRFFGWQVVGQLRLRQAPLRRTKRHAPAAPNSEAAQHISAQLTEIRNGELRDALARLGAAIKQP